jgi:hypothetical protein
MEFSILDDEGGSKRFLRQASKELLILDQFFIHFLARRSSSVRQ